MPQLKKEIDIKCPFCGRPLVASEHQLNCHLCHTEIIVDDKGDIKQFYPPVYHEQLTIVFSILAFLFAMGIMVEAAATHHAMEKLIAMFVVIVGGFLSYLVAPWNTPVSISRPFSRSWTIVVVAVVLGLMLILNVANVIQY
jgi:hypothetical protein